MNPLILGALLLYLAFLAFCTVWGIFLGYHMLRFAPRRETAVLSIGAFVIVTLALLFFSLAALLRLDWSASFAVPLSGF